jgi:hypothetical protein
MSSREQFERRQRVSREALEKMASLRLPQDADESFYAAMREGLLDAGATDAEIDGAAVHCVTIVVESMRPEWEEERRDQFELIATYLACTAMVVRLGKGDSFIAIQFTDRPRVH